MGKADVIALVRAAIDSPTNHLPVPPATAIKLLQITRKPDVQFDEVVSLMEEDPVVAAKVLSVAQSSFYSRGARITSLRDAIVRIGLLELAQLFLEITASVRIFKAKGFEQAMNQLKRHSSAAAQLSRVISKHANVDHEHTFMCALLHDVGVAIAANAVGTLWPIHMVWPGIIEAHAEVGRMVCEAWQLPPAIAPFVAAHHLHGGGGPVHPALCVITISDWMAARLGFPVVNEPLPVTPAEEIRTLGLTDEQLAQIQVEAKEIANRIK
jgi:HD-like signal output (HDOD) protein